MWVPISEYLRELRQKIGTSLVLMPGVAAIVRDEAGNVLVQRRSDNGKWGLPAGSIEPGETPAEAIVREVWEETGLRVIPERVVGVFGGKAFRTVYPNGDQVEYTVVLFECKNVGGELQPLDGEALEFRYIPPEHLADFGWPYPRYLFERDKVRSTVFQWNNAWLDTLNTIE
jgi:8-oxo-dGTP pyrophosphatase MutT (NUDIX family)